MKCSRCSAEIPAQSQFCLRCGTPVRGNAPTMAGPAAYPSAPAAQMAPPRANRNPLIAIIAVLVLAILGLGAMVLIQKAGKSDAGKLVAAPAAAGNGSLVQKPAEASPGATVAAPREATPNAVVTQPDTTQPFPADIDDYLKFLKRIEARKQALIRTQTGDALLMMTQAKGLSATIEEKDYNDAFKSMNATMQKNSQDWNALTQEFNNRQPPPACVDLRNKFLDQLGKIQAAIFAVNDALAHVQTDPSSVLHTLTDMQGKTSADVDASIEAADSALADVCDKYRLKKDFDIRGDSGSTGLLR
jgi:hypothetical protein